MALASVLRRNHARNVATLKRQPLDEISGALGDLGTFLPLAIALAMNGTISLPATLVFSGLFNIATGVIFGIPLPVQPMKAVAAAAIANKFSPQEIAAAGLFVGGSVMILSATGLLSWVAGVVPIPVVKGIQMGAGLSLIMSAGNSIKTSLHWLHPWFDNYIWVVAAFIGLLLANLYRRMAYGLLLVTLCVTIACAQIAGDNRSIPSLAFWIPSRSDIVLPDADSWRAGILEAGIGQLPLTTLNSVLAVVYLAAELLPSSNPPTSMTAVGFSVGLMNLAGCWFSAMPVCHGSGGLAAQYHFGARSGASVILLGLLKVVVGVTCGNTILALLDEFPVSLLGVMVIAAGLQLANVGESLNTDKAWDIAERKRRLEIASTNAGGNASTHNHAHTDSYGGRLPPLLKAEERSQRWTVMLVTMGMLLAFKNDGIGFLAGLTCHWIYQASAILEHLRYTLQEGRVRLEEGQQSRPGDD